MNDYMQHMHMHMTDVCICKYLTINIWLVQKT